MKPMQLILESSVPVEYLQCTDVIDFNSPHVVRLAEELYNGDRNEIALVKRVYEYVRDQVAHSWDIGARERVWKASEVLAKRHGNCCGKSHLLAALLRYLKVPTGFCYQWLISDDDDRYLVLHGLNAVFLKSINRWIRLDARGNKPGVQAEFSIESERLAWPVRVQLGEQDEETVWANPKKEVVNRLNSNKDINRLSDDWIYKVNPLIGSVDNNVQETKA
jgi:transglutaminase-like putative cysteine protease